MSEIAAILPREILNNIIVVFTNTVNELVLHFDPKQLQEFFGQPIKHFFCINNPYSQFEVAKKKQTLLQDEIAKHLQKAFEEAAVDMNEMIDIMEKLEGCTPGE